MGDLLIRDMPKSLHNALKRLSRESNRSMSDISKEILRAGLEVKTPAVPRKSRNAWEVLRATIGEENLLSDDEHAEFERYLEEARKGPHRPLPDFE